MASRDAKNELVRDKLLKVQTLRLPFTITGASSTQNVVVTQEDPSLLFIRTQGQDRITVAAGALVTGQSAPSYASAVDSAGQFGIMVRVYETVTEVLGAKIVHRSAGGSVLGCGLANTTGIGPNSDQICLNADVAEDFSTSAVLDAYLEVSYINAE